MKQIISFTLGSLFIYLLLSSNPFGIRSYFDNQRKQENSQQQKEFIAGLEDKALNGDAKAMYEYATYSKDQLKSYKYFLSAANAGHPQAMHKVAKLSTDSKKQIEWLRKSANSGNTCAIFDIGTYELVSDERNFEKAYKLYRLAAEKGHHQAQENLCEMYFYGVGAQHDVQNAMKWCSIASMDRNITEDHKSEVKRMGAVWKSSLIETLNLDESAAHNLKVHEHTDDLSAWNCESIFDAK